MSKNQVKNNSLNEQMNFIPPADIQIPMPNVKPPKKITTKPPKNKKKD